MPELKGHFPRGVRVCFVGAGGAENEDFRALPPEESAEALAFAGGARRAEFVRTRSALRSLLSTISGNAFGPRQWRFQRGGHGKPRLEKDAGFPEFEFSISHTPLVSVIAASNGMALGVDIEPCSVPRARTIPASVVLCPAEEAVYAALPVPGRWRYFLELWTAKEAYAKYLGLGFSLDFTAVYVDTETRRLSVSDTAGKWTPAPAALLTETVTFAEEDFVFSLVTPPGQNGTRPVIRHHRRSAHANTVSVPAPLF